MTVPGLLRRPSPRVTNRTLLVLLLLVLLSGLAAWTVGTADGRWVVVGHGVAGLLVLLLVPWKQRIVRTGLARRRATRAASVCLALLTVAALVTGLLHSTGAATAAAGQLMLWWHVAMGFALVPLLAWHAVARRQRLRRTDLDRRLLLRSGALAATAGGLWLATEGAVRLAGMPGAGRRFTGSYEVAVPRPTIWLADSRPRHDPATWRLRVTDADGSRELDLARLQATTSRVRAVLDCTSGWYSEQEWEGVPVAALLRVTGTAQSLVVTSATGYRRRFPLDEVAGLLLAHAMAGEPLKADHGAPLRLVAPGRRGYWWVKWVDRVELSEAPPWWQPTFPLT